LTHNIPHEYVRGHGKDQSDNLASTTHARNSQISQEISGFGQSVLALDGSAIDSRSLGGQEREERQGEMKRELQPTIESTLRWPDGWPRTLIEHRQSRSAWKKHIMEYQKAITKELIAMKVTAASITFNSSSSRDPGVAVWYSLQSAEDVSWQIGLQIDNPAPTLDEIDSAFKRLAVKCHPDTHPDDPNALEMFKKINLFREDLNTLKGILFRQYGAFKAAFGDTAIITTEATDKWTSIKQRLAPRLREAVDILLLQGSMKRTQLAAALKMDYSNCTKNVVTVLKAQGWLVENNGNLSLKVL
jgi:hypothetical protein